MHQAEDEIAAVGVAIGASYAGKVAFTITSGPGMALKTEFLGLAVMAEIPLVVVDVQRGGPSTGLPTKVEQGDLLATLFGQPGDAPKVVMAPSTIEECFHSMITARKLAETLPHARVRADRRQPGDRRPAVPTPELTRTGWRRRRPEPRAGGTRPYDWDPETGLSRRFIPGQPGGCTRLTGLAHDETATSPTSPPSTSAACACAAASSPYSRAR